jgi:pyruvate/2-oxoacid:ferredoxin oxidoreductase beta subunit
MGGGGGIGVGVGATVGAAHAARQINKIIADNRIFRIIRFLLLSR